MDGVFKQGELVAGFHNIAAVHNIDAVGIAGHQPQIVGDDDDGETLVAGKLLQQIQNLCLRGDVQRGGSFVGNQYFRLGGNGHGNHDALTHTARKMLRILVIAAFRIRNADLAHNLQGALLGGVLIQFQVKHDGFLNLVADGQHRVQRGHRLLEDHTDFAAADAAHLAAFEAVFQNIARSALEVDLAGFNLARRHDEL